ncbi:YtxH domain-containing protein [Corynebacterium amycolatum]|uniref:YtxH domain-containing protein n=1 Tax=Corynebacterium amycolatum TaxID=43765 RepID=A0AAW9SUR1_CORAY|nr:YtxH domain-containing protein [Corynebacterium amycolatum]MDK7110162.1 YtxH domain-containing protein [Corynebacterium amycolatum]MDK7144779.1 YtxH domain-containing protein [Corynebacterium amycolatum]MDK7236697.1 YtxH domain-containing protein [Corynebacterium amycolatum]MDK7246594.1 YtxH domain-containing protein [Corynebacterium amycolatum]
MQNKKMTRIATAIVGSAALLGGLAACSSDDAQDAANNAKDQAGQVATDATDKAGDAMDGAKDKAGEAADGAKDKANEAMNGLGLGDAAGEDVAEADLPESITEAASSFTSPYGTEAGEFKSAKKVGDAVAAEYENVTFVESPETNGAQPLIGKIRETWVANGALENEIGLPTAPESEIENGWEQPFTKDTMKWTSEDGQNYSDSYENK